MQKNIGDLKPREKSIDLVFKVVSKGEAREVNSKLDGSTHKVSDVTVGDASGTIILTLWDDKIDSVEEGKSYKLENGYTSLFKSSLRLNVGRYGNLSASDEDVEVNMDNNMSEKEFSSGYNNYSRRY